MHQLSCTRKVPHCNKLSPPVSCLFAVFVNPTIIVMSPHNDYPTRELKDFSIGNRNRDEKLERKNKICLERSRKLQRKFSIPQAPKRRGRISILGTLTSFYPRHSIPWSRRKFSTNLLPFSSLVHLHPTMDRRYLDAPLSRVVRRLTSRNKGT